MKRQFVKYYFKIFLEQCLKIFWVFPIRSNQILFCASAGRQFACNPKYIYEMLKKEYPFQFRFIWVIENKKSVPREVICVRKNTIRYCFYMLTSKVIVDNNGLNAFLPYRKHQLKVNTWHAGGAYKKTGVDSTLPVTEYLRLKREGRKTDIVLSSCRRFSEVFPDSYHINVKAVRETGLPRNDCLFGETSDVKKLVYDKLGIAIDKKLILYAPTFRGQSVSASHQDYELNVEECILALKERFGGEWVMGFRMHHVYHDAWQTIKNSISLCEYPDMQELLIAADVLITDYSSSMWDFSLMEKPCFVFAPDLKDYEKDVDFYTPISEWPFPVAENNRELRDKIHSFDLNTYKNAVKKHHEELGDCETGIASHLLSNAIYGYCFERDSKTEFLKEYCRGENK